MCNVFFFNETLLERSQVPYKEGPHIWLSQLRARFQQCQRRAIRCCECPDWENPGARYDSRSFYVFDEICSYLHDSWVFIFLVINLNIISWSSVSGCGITMSLILSRYGKKFGTKSTRDSKESIWISCVWIRLNFGNQLTNALVIID